MTVKDEPKEEPKATKAKREPSEPRYRVVRSVSTRKAEDSDEVITWNEGRVFKDWPEHVNIKELLKIGAIEEVKEDD